MTEKKNKTHRRIKTTADTNTMVYGKVPPQARELEQAVLGAIMLEQTALDQASELMTAERFYVEANQQIFRAMQELSRQGQPIDILTVTEVLRRNEQLEMVGGQYYVTTLTNYVVSAANIQNHCRLLYEKWLKRELIRLGGQLVNDGYEDSTDAFELLGLLETQMQAISLNTGTSIKGLDGLLVERFKRIMELRKQDQHITGVPSGFHDVDKITHGWQNSDLIIIAARPSVGKTAFALNIARNAGSIQIGDRPPVKVGIFSLEMSAGQLVDRVMAAESEVWLDRIQTGKIEEAQLQQLYTRGVQPLSTRGIYVDDTPALDVYQLRSKARYMMRQYGVGLLIVDYLQLMSGVEDRKINNREQEISNISRNLKKLAKELNIPIIALSQLSRDVEKRKGEKQQPRLSDLRDSGAIEQDADVVLFMYRPEYYDINSDETGESTHGLTEISIAKHRNGSLAQGDQAIKLRALLQIQKFVPWTGNLSAELGTGNWRPVMGKEKGDELPFQ